MASPPYERRQARPRRDSRFSGVAALFRAAGTRATDLLHVFGHSNSYRYQRLFGELHLDGFEVSHTKDGFRWDENEQPFLELLREYLDSGDVPLLKTS